MGNLDLECWMGDGKVYLHKPGEDNDVEIEINNDGTHAPDSDGRNEKEGK